jgi:hypothetical protein
MSRLFRILTAVVFAVHLMMGCCWHHAHACESQGDMQPTHEQCPDSHNGETGHSQHGSQDCQGIQCSFVASISPTSISFAQPSHVFAIVPLTSQPSLVGGDFEQHGFIASRLFPSVCLYLVNQVLLI